MNKSYRIIIGVLFSALLLGACSSQNNTEASNESSDMMGNGGMMRFHMATVPSPYTGLENPVSSDDASIIRGQDIYTIQCASCHGDGGMGDGPVAVSLDPAPAAVAHTSQMMGDDYLFWRISEGGSEFGTGMVPFKGTLTEEERWDIINYVRALGSNEIMPVEQYGGATNDPEIQAAQQAEMLAAGVTQAVITEDEAEFFANLHAMTDDFIQNNRAELTRTDVPVMESGLDAMVAQDLLSEEDAHLFLDIHNRLLEAGLMQ